MTRDDPVSLKTGARSDAADQVFVVCCPMGIRRRVKREEGARWGVMRRHSMWEKGTKITERANRAERCPKRCSCTYLESCTDNERILSENPCSQIMHSLFLKYLFRRGLFSRSIHPYPYHPSGLCPTEIQLSHLIVDLGPVLPTGTHCEQPGRRVCKSEIRSALLKTRLPKTPEGPEARPGWRFRRYALGKWRWTITTVCQGLAGTVSVTICPSRAPEAHRS